MPQDTIRGPLLFLIYINDLSRPIKHSKIHLFADDTNLLYASSSLKDNKKINSDLLNLNQWFRANKTTSSVNKLALQFFDLPENKSRKKLTSVLVIRKLDEKPELNILEFY